MWFFPFSCKIYILSVTRYCFLSDDMSKAKLLWANRVYQIPQPAALITSADNHFHVSLKIPQPNTFTLFPRLTLTNRLTHTLVHISTRSLGQAVDWSVGQPASQPLTEPALTQPLNQSLRHSLSHSDTHSVTQSLIHTHTHTHTHSLIHSFTHSFTHTHRDMHKNAWVCSAEEFLELHGKVEAVVRNCLLRRSGQKVEVSGTPFRSKSFCFRHIRLLCSEWSIFPLVLTYSWLKINLNVWVRTVNTNLSFYLKIQKKKTFL